VNLRGRQSAPLYRHWGSVQAVRPIGGVEVIALLFHDHGTRRGWGVSVTLRPLFTPGKTRYPLYRRLGGPHYRSGQVRKISSPPGFDPRTVQPVASRYTNYATRTTFEVRGTQHILRGNEEGGIRAQILVGDFPEYEARVLHSTLWLSVGTCMLDVTSVSLMILR